MVYREWHEIPNYLAKYFDGVDVDCESTIDECDTIMTTNYRDAIAAIVAAESAGDLEWFYFNWSLPDSAWEYFLEVANLLIISIDKEYSHKLYDFIEEFIGTFVIDPTTKERLYTRLEKYE